MIEVFDPRDGVPVYKTRFRFMAWLIAKLYKLYYAKEGEGWLCQSKNYLSL
jgi:hypothetical protein